MTATECQHLRATLVSTRYDTWPAIETYECNHCHARFERTWSDE